MKTTGTMLLAVLLSLLFAATSFAIIAGSDHDLSGLGSTEVCIFCHTPHNSVAGVEPLWSGTVTGETFSPYASSTFNGGAFLETDYAAGPSRLCLSCHDGTISIDSAVGDTTLMTGDAVLGTNLSNDHPIGFDYTAIEVADGELVLSSTAGALAGDTIASHLFGGTIMTCATCHDVHEDGVSGDFLLVENGASALCLSCHVK